MSAEADLAAVHLLPTGRRAPQPVLLDPQVLEANLVLGFDPRNDQVQPFFTLRSSLLRHVNSTGQQIIALTSVEPGNGKTHAAINLAAVLSRITPTVLIELDLRRPCIASRLGLPDDQPGTDDYLQGAVEWHDTRIAIQGSDLTVHRARRPRANAQSLLASSYLTSAIDRLRSLETRPLCIIDTPPALVSDDLALISRVADGFLVVAEEARTRKKALRGLANAVGTTPIIGAILNRSLFGTVRSDHYAYYAETACEADG